MDREVKPRRRIKGVSKAPEMTRSRIINAAIELFGKQGYRATSTEKIAERAGYADATVFFHFKTKGGLLKACLEAARERAFKQSLLEPNAGSVLELVKNIDGTFADKATANFMSRMLMEQQANVDVQAIYSEFHFRVRQRISQQLVQETGASIERADFVASAILSMSIGVHAEYRVEPTKYSREDYGEMLLLVTKLLVESVGNS